MMAKRPAPEYVATAPIFIGGARAFNPGDPVPAEHVERFGLTDKVARQSTTASAATDGEA
jgi:hypothetical protein